MKFYINKYLISYLICGKIRTMMGDQFHLGNEASTHEQLPNPATRSHIPKITHIAPVPSFHSRVQSFLDYSSELTNRLPLIFFQRQGVHQVKCHITLTVNENQLR